MAPTIANLYSLDNFTNRSGTPLFDHDYNLIEKKYSISELTYHNDYQMKIVGENNCSMLIEGKMNRETLIKDYDSFYLKDYDFGSKNKNDFINFMISNIKNLKFEEKFKARVTNIIKKLDE